ncbi:metallophosphoesterase family protein [Hypericibacter sp.]|uniref:metallophosphoesterase family protein n=1 Tax=Hypericibacter sp. TaxID=2705401 RepID=UPI003D6D26E0
MFTLAHLSDPHLSGWPLPAPNALLSKRVLGFLSWQLRRRFVHRQDVLDRVAADLAQSHPDHVAITGDITNISLPREFENAAAWLQRIGPPDRVSVIPGNHDRYIELPWSKHLALWDAYMTGDVRAGDTERFPYLRRRGPLALIGLSSAEPMPYNSAAGHVGGEQLARLAAMLPALEAEGLFRVVLIHHPPQARATHDRKALLDAAAFRDVLAQKGAELVLHGHTHRAHLDHLAGPRRRIPVLGVPSASAMPHGGKPAGGYHLYRVTRAGSGWDLEIETRALPQKGGSLETTGRFRLASQPA